MEIFLDKKLSRQSGFFRYFVVQKNIAKKLLRENSDIVHRFRIIKKFYAYSALSFRGSNGAR